MHSSIIITGLCAALAVAKPVQKFGKFAKKDVVTDFEIEIDTVYFTVTVPFETAAPTSTIVVVNTVYDNGEQFKAAAVTSSPAAVLAAYRPYKKPTTAPQPTTSQAVDIVVPKPSPTTAPVVVAPQPTTPAAQPSTTSTPTTDTSYEGVILAQHNLHRANHSASALVYNETLAAYAKTTALTCVWGHDMTQGGGNYGQNIVENGQLPWTGVNIASAAAFGITEQWYNGEEPFYSSSFGLDNPNTSADVLHFTQVVWKATTSVGCYTAQCAQGTVDARAPTAYTVCNYFPQGNFGGEYATNVGQPIGNPTNHQTIEWSS